MDYHKLISHYLYPFYEERFRRRNTFYYYSQCLANEELSSSEIYALQLAQLKQLLHHCYENVPFYHKSWNELDFHPDDFNHQEDIANLPLLTKDIIRNNYNDLRAKNFLGNTVKKATGGSTGVPLQFELDLECYQRRQGVMWRGYSWCGAHIGQRTLYLWGGDIGNTGYLKSLKNRLYHSAFNRKILNTFFLSNNNIPRYVDQINKYKPEIIVAYVTPVYDIAKYIVEHNVSVHAPKAILTGAEPLFPYQREAVESAFNAKVFNTYGCREFTLIASECSERQQLHINTDYLIVETVDSEGNPVDGQGNIAITDLFNYGMPLIRYVNGDIGTLDDRPCDCGLPFPILKNIDGRRLDRIITSEGNVIPGEFFPHMLKDFVGIEKFQVVQTELTKIDISLIVNEAYSPDSEKIIRKNVYDIAGDSLRINFNYPDSIPLTNSGKHRVTISKLSEAL